MCQAVIWQGSAPCRVLGSSPSGSTIFFIHLAASIFNKLSTRLFAAANQLGNDPRSASTHCGHSHRSRSPLDTLRPPATQQLNHDIDTGPESFSVPQDDDACPADGVETHGTGETAG